jgi:hypothetical protein
MPLASPSTTHHAAGSSTDRTGLAVAALVCGALAAGIALTVAFLGVFLPYAWYAVVGLGVLTLVFGLLSVGRKHHRSAVGGALAWIGTAGALVALVLGVWGMTDVLRGAHHNTVASSSAPATVLSPAPDRVAAPLAVPTTVPVGPQVPLGRTFQIDDVSVRVTGPDLDYRPSPVAASSDGNGIVRAVEFTATITNDTNGPLTAAGVDFECLVDGQPVGHVYDQNIRGLTQDLQPGQTVTFPIAFNLPAGQTPLLLQVEPQSMNSTDKFFYVGTA